MPSKGNVAAMAALIVVAIAAAALAVFFWISKTRFLSSDNGHHYNRALIFTAIALIALVGAYLVRPRASA